MSKQKGGSFSAARIATRVSAMGKEITRAYKGRRIDVVVTLDRGLVFAADILRAIQAPVVCHFIHENVRDVKESGHARREVYFGSRPELKGRDVLVLDAVFETGVTQDFLLRGIGESRPRSLRLAVLLYKPARRKVDLEPDYFGFKTASNDVWVGYGLAGANGMGRNHRGLVKGAAPMNRKRRAK